jgi:hypothetical protein
MKGGMFIELHMLLYEASVFLVSSEALARLKAFYEYSQGDADDKF